MFRHQLAALAEELRRPDYDIAPADAWGMVALTPRRLLSKQWPRLLPHSPAQLAPARVLYPPDGGGKGPTVEKLESTDAVMAHPHWQLFARFPGGIPGMPNIIREDEFEAAWKIAREGAALPQEFVTLALPDYFKGEQGTAIVWGEASGTGGITVTNTLSLDALANGSGRMGASVDLGATFDQDYLVALWVETGTAPTAGTVAELYLASSTDNSNWPGKVTGSDAAYPTTVADNKKQLWPPVTLLVASADGNTVLKQNPVVWRPTGRYVAPVVVNSLGQAFRDEATASNNDSRVILVPLRSLVQDTA